MWSNLPISLWLGFRVDSHIPETSRPSAITDDKVLRISAHFAGIFLSPLIIAVKSLLAEWFESPARRAHQKEASLQ
jgi:hypothetical protein